MADVFRLKNEEFVSMVNLDTLVPKLCAKKLLTAIEHEEVTYVGYKPYDRKSKLAQILSQKGPNAPSQVVDCLRAETTHTLHNTLADIIEKFLKERDPGSPNTATNGASVRQVPNSPNSPTSSHDSDTNPSADGAGTGDGDVLGPLDTLKEKASPEYAKLILAIAAELSHNKITFSTIMTCLKAVLEKAAIPMCFPCSVNNVPSLFLFLYEKRMCHETDVDLLNILLRELKMDHMNSYVREYLRKNEHTNVMHFGRYAKPKKGSDHFLVFTFHSRPSVTLGEATKIKHCLSDLLDIPKHTVTLADSNPGSVVLVWQIPIQSQTQCVMAFRRLSLFSDPIIVEYGLTKVELELEYQCESERKRTLVYPIEDTTRMAECNPKKLLKLHSATSDEDEAADEHIKRPVECTADLDLGLEFKLFLSVRKWLPFSQFSKFDSQEEVVELFQKMGLGDGSKSQIKRSDSDSPVSEQ